MKAKHRILGRGESYYHITTRVVDKIFRFTPEENERNVELLRCVEAFSGVEVLSYCFMSNHIHILLRVPEPEEITEATLLERIGVLYGGEFQEHLKMRWEYFREHKCGTTLESEQASYLRRMNSLPEFMKTLKLRLSISYNLRHEREGTLWESRYHSVFLEGSARVLSAVAAYIDLNPVRGGMVSDPKDYRYSSYGEACRGGARARAGLCRIYQEGGGPRDWKEVAPSYRTRLVLKAMPTEKRAGMKPEDIRKALEDLGEITVEEIVSDRCAYFTRGEALGSEDFLRYGLKTMLLRRAERMQPRGARLKEVVPNPTPS